MGLVSIPTQFETSHSDIHSNAHQHVCSSEEVAEWIVQQVNEGGCVQVSIAHHLGSKQGLSGATAEKATHHAVAHVHVMCDFLKGNKENRKTLMNLMMIFGHKDI